ncbi:bacteriocin immunity protein [Pseudomonas putida]|uniref:bacteriocin immunity protein n=1 Tax=Pseudomonas putida TaxID=303 RepID=UPI0018D68141|nr:bacteriocin immunity protein [Pseudomonas putida]MBH3461473.1 bacteriocin immunity protein [Pseudomonas putida]
MKKNLSDYTEKEFLSFLDGIATVDPLIYPSEKAHTKAVLEFERLTQHPLGSDLLYYPKKHGLDGTLEELVKVLTQWRAEQGLPGFKPE